MRRHLAAAPRRLPTLTSLPPTLCRNPQVTNINKSFHDADGTEVCVYLRPTNQCNTLSRLCPYGDGTCVVGLFNTPGGKSTNCCPLSWVKGY